MQLKREIKFETLRKSHKKQIIIGVIIVLLVVSTITLTMSKSKYRLTQSMKLVTGTINYKVPDLRVVALYTENDNNEYVESDNVPTSGYTLNEEKSICRVYDGTTSIAEAPIDTKAIITYQNGLVTFANISKKNTRCYLYFDKYIGPASETTLAKLNINSRFIKEGTPDFTKVATKTEPFTDNGIYKTSDPMYGENAETYYWRGAAAYNHVIFANKCWRIIRINGDGTIRLIYNGDIQEGNTCMGNEDNKGSIAVKQKSYNPSYSNSSYAGYTYTDGVQRPTPPTGGTASNLKIQTETWYNDNIGNNAIYASKVADGKYCNDRTIGTGSWSLRGSAFQYGGYQRLLDKKPTLGCDSQDVYTLKVGAIVLDEVCMAGYVQGLNNTSCYLNTGADYWTMTPKGWNGDPYRIRIYYVDYRGNASYTDATNNNPGIRPVINLRSDVTFNPRSDGTQNSPYIVQ